MDVVLYLLLCIVWTLCTCSAIVIAFLLKATWLDLTWPLLEKCWMFTQKTVTAHRKQVSSAAGNSTFWQRFVNIENLLNGAMDLYKIWWQYSKFIKACACLIMCNAVQVCTCQSQTFRGHFFGTHCRCGTRVIPVHVKLWLTAYLASFQFNCYIYEFVPCFGCSGTERRPAVLGCWSELLAHVWRTRVPVYRTMHVWAVQWWDVCSHRRHVPLHVVQ